MIKKAKITVAAKMEDPASVEFVDIKRVMNKNTFEIICGHIKGKRKSGEATGERPFLYLVKEDEAYIVDRGPDSMAAIVYRANSPARVRADRNPSTKELYACPAKPAMSLSRHAACTDECPLSGVERTWRLHCEMSAYLTDFPGASTAMREMAERSS